MELEVGKILEGKISGVTKFGAFVSLPNGEMFVCMAGNPGMAVGGSGDVLAGIINSLLAQGLSPESAAICGVQIHAHCGDIAASKMSMQSMLPTDIIDSLPLLFKEIED